MSRQQNKSTVTLDCSLYRHSSLIDSCARLAAQIPVEELLLGDLAVAVLVEQEQRRLQLVAREGGTQRQTQCGELLAVQLAIFVRIICAESSAQLGFGVSLAADGLQRSIAFPGGMEDDHTDDREEQARNEVQDTTLANHEDTHEEVKRSTACRITLPNGFIRKKCEGESM